jgi:two-component system, chemotaxis family, protein-glutamate methylesterase/glutaminase
VKKRIRVVVVDDSAFCRELLRAILEQEGDIEVVGEAADGNEARDVVVRLRPDVATLDIEMPKTDGLSAIRRIMAESPTPILVVTGRPAEERSHTLFEAVRRGALDLFPKPSAGSDEEGRALRLLVRRLAAIPVMRHIRSFSTRPPLLPIDPTRTLGRVRMIGIGASAGGPAAVAAVLRELPVDMTASVAVVQHLLTGFTRPFCDFLRHHTRLEVRVVDEAVTVRSGIVYVAPDDRHLVAPSADRLAPSDADAVSGHRPSVDTLFLSLARAYKNTAAGVILSGMGEDGARGLGAMAQEGALTIAQAEAGCAVYGMPRAAVERGAARRSLPLGEISAALLRATREEGSP